MGPPLLGGWSIRSGLFQKRTFFIFTRENNRQKTLFCVLGYVLVIEKLVFSFCKYMSILMMFFSNFYSTYRLCKRSQKVERSFLKIIEKIVRFKSRNLILRYKINFFLILLVNTQKI